MYSKERKNVYKHKIKTIDVNIANCSRDNFTEKLLELPYLMYKVESLLDGREIVVNKPGGKRSFGKVIREDFMVWIHDVSNEMLWLISHKDILEDLKSKSSESRGKTLDLIGLMEKVFNGEEPLNMMSEISALTFDNGESPELLLKAYKWIWGQEDCNYPKPKYKGREMSMEGVMELKMKLIELQS